MVVLIITTSGRGCVNNGNGTVVVMTTSGVHSAAMAVGKWRLAVFKKVGQAPTLYGSILCVRCATLPSSLLRQDPAYSKKLLLGTAWRTWRLRPGQLCAPSAHSTPCPQRRAAGLGGC
jgi:hypothetical protein